MGGSEFDPRMRGFRSRASVDDVQALIDRRVGMLGSEAVDLAEASGRVLAGPVASGVDVPAFDRSAMDGYALRGEETFGADPYNPARFRVVGRSRPGRSPGAALGPGEAAAIATGAPLPPGADAVAKVESTRLVGDLVEVVEPTPPGRHVGRVGEDVRQGTVVLPEGRALRPQDLGLLAAIGLGRVEVVRRPSVTVIVTGDELLAAGSAPSGWRIVDANSPMLVALITRDGGIARVVGPLADDPEVIGAAMDDAASSSDAVFLSGGSSTGPEDHAPALLAARGDLAVHGVGLRPASPTGLGFMNGRPVLLLPGNPVSCLCAYDFFGGRIVRRLAGRPPGWPHRPVDLPLARKVVSSLGRVDYGRVRVVDGRVEPLAVGGASILSGVTRADGFVVIPADSEGAPAGAIVRVWLYDADSPG